MHSKTNYQVLIGPSGEQIIRSTASNCKTVIDINQKTGIVTIGRRW
ncbi:hypothetical protein [Methanocella sp. MCL-LM]